MRELQITQTITNRETRAVETYLHELGKLNLISTEEEVTLAKQVRQGDKAALDRLVKTNLRFVVSVAKRYQHQGMPLCDLISEGNLGLIKAAKKFDETRGFKFISFAVWWIRQSILAALTENSRMIRLPMNKIHDISKINKAMAVVEQETLRKPSAEQVAEYLDMSPEKVNEALYVAPWITSLDKPFGDGDEYSPYERLYEKDNRTDGALMAEDASLEISMLLSRLSERERSVIDMSFGLSGDGEVPAAEIARCLGLSRERVRQILNEALYKLRNIKST
jgi:RNA polymerase primary sigma factor